MEKKKMNAQFQATSLSDEAMDDVTGGRASPPAPSILAHISVYYECKNCGRKMSEEALDRNDWFCTNCRQPVDVNTAKKSYSN